ncbi:probable ATP-dependent RNA helicase DHX58 [Erpetoichthys calabaricus]|uniref:RNA helicase n=1 Tax=Erpetoichthys calabaricus TaxID=27687 RepID=A0A8C4TJH6_ERPCA|nr:probable ATP-dependent RNA helicase DHX58 [Erpetoichthys calabaricus]
MNLYQYQQEVIQPALEGRNIIIWLPTGGGKTRAAVYVAKHHLETKPQAKVAVLVNKVHLVDQHYNKEFSPFLARNYRIAHISGDSEEKEFFAKVVQDSDIIICTAQILENALKNPDEMKHVELTDFTLLIIDECHHTHKDAVYNKIMERYVEMKLQLGGPLPQVLGLTASPGTGGAKNAKGAKEHILQICANLDAWAIMSVKEHSEELEQKVPKPRKQFDIPEDRPQDPFGEKVKEMMREIHAFMDYEDISQNFGTQDYEQAVVLLEKEGTIDCNRRVRHCALYLRKYNDALLINDAVRMIDAFNSLDDFHSGQRARHLDLDQTDHFLLELFEDKKNNLRRVANIPDYENPKLKKLEKTLLEQFQNSTMSRGILFTKTRRSAHSLNQWVKTNRLLQDAGIKASILTGAGISNQAPHMTQSQQQEVIRRFRSGDLNLLISTSVAEEGLDIPECNLVVRYGLLTNEIAMKQAKGRARAEDSVYSVVANRNGRELQRENTNEYLDKLTEEVVAEIQDMSPRDYHLEIRELQKKAIMKRRMTEEKEEAKRNTHRPEVIRLYCRRCSTAVCHGSDMRVIEGSLHVNINPDFEIYFTLGTKVILEKKFEDWEPGCSISCSNCGQDWGYQVIYKAVTLPMLSIKNFGIETPSGNRSPKKWKDVTFPMEEFNYIEYCMMKFGDLGFD